MPDQILSTLTASKILGCSPETVRNLADQGKLPSIKMIETGRRLFRLSDVEYLLGEREKAKSQRRNKSYGRSKS